MFPSVWVFFFFLNVPLSQGVLYFLIEASFATFPTFTVASWLNGLFGDWCAHTLVYTLAPSLSHLVSSPCTGSNQGGLGLPSVPRARGYSCQNKNSSLDCFQCQPWGREDLVKYRTWNTDLLILRAEQGK